MRKLFKCSLIILIALILAPTIYGQSRYFKYKTIRKDDDFSFPVFQGRGYPVRKINQLLQIAELELLKGFETQDIFEKASFDRGGIYGGKVDIKYSINHNTSKLLSIKLTEASCGATCHYWVRYYNFNSGNGDLVQLKDLFTEKGYTIFFKKITAKRIADFKRELKKLDPATRDGLMGITGSYEEDDLKDFYVRGGNLFIDGENSFLKNDKFYGVETVSRFRIRDLKRYMNGYGKCLFSLSKCSIKNHRSQILPQLFHGTMAGKSVLMILNTDYGNGMRAEYLHTGSGKGTYLDGELNGAALTLHEKDEKYKDSAFISAIFDGERIVGTWTNKEGTETRELSLTRR